MFRFFSKSVYTYRIKNTWITSIFNPVHVTLFTKEARRGKCLLKCLTTEEVRCLLF